MRGSSVLVVAQYLLDNFPIYGNHPVGGAGIIADYAGGSKQVLNAKGASAEGVTRSSDEELKKYVLMTRNGAAVCATPQEKLRDALMSLNFLVVEESFQAFNEVCRR